MRAMAIDAPSCLTVPRGPGRPRVVRPAREARVRRQEAEGKAALYALGDELSDLQERLFAEGGHRRQPPHAAGAPGHGHLRQGRHRCGTPSGWSTRRACTSSRSRRRPTAEQRHDFLWRVEQEVPERRDDRGLRPVALRGRADRAGPRAGAAPRRSSAATARSTTSRSGWSTRARRVVKCMLHISAEEQKERLLARLDDPTKHWKFNPGDIDERQRWADYREAYEIALERTNTDARALVRRARATASGTATWPIGRAPARDAAGDGPELAGRRLRRRRAAAAGCSTRRRCVSLIRTVTATRYVAPLREGGSLPGHRRGRRPRHLRLQVPRRRPGAQGAGRRGGRRRAGPRRSGMRTPRAGGASTSSAAIAKLRGGRGGPGPAHRQHRAEPRRGLPAGLVRVRRRLHARPRRSPPRSCGWTP